MADIVPHVCVKFPDKIQHKLMMAALGVFYCRSQREKYRCDNLQRWVEASSSPPSPFTPYDMKCFRKTRETVSDEILWRCLGSHCVLNAFNGVDFGYGGCVHSATVADVMHSFESGLVKIVLELLLHPLPPSNVGMIDSLVEKSFGSSNRSSASRDYPRVSFTRGFCSLTLLSSSERVGQLFVVALLLNTPQGKDLFQNRFSATFDSARNARKSSFAKKRKMEQDSSSESDSELNMESDDPASYPDVIVPRNSYSSTQRALILEQLDLSCVLDLQLTLQDTNHDNLCQVLDKELRKSRRLDQLLQKKNESGSSFQLIQPGILDYTRKDMDLVARTTGPDSWPQNVAEMCWENPPAQVTQLIDPQRKECSIKLTMSNFKELVELMLCFHSYVKYGGHLLMVDKDAAVSGYQRNFHRMMTLISKGMERPESSMQFRLQKFVECSHFLMEHLSKGPVVGNNTDTGERGLKKWAKSPARTAQNRGDSVFKQQVARNYHEFFFCSKNQFY
jgi:hypothetical protein